MIANSITLVRILLLPIPCVILLFLYPISYWIAFFLFIFLGATDFIDGLVARKEGPTVLGAFLDPVADKILVSAIVLSLSGNGWIPYWFPSAIIFREFLLIILRSSLALRNEYIKTTILAKVKTIVQMGGFGTIFMSLFLPLSFAIIVAACCFCFFIIICSWYFFSEKKMPYWPHVVSLAFLYWLVLLISTSIEIAIICQCLIILGLTWISALKYFRTGYLALKENSMQGWYHIIQLAWAIGHSICILVASSNVSFIMPLLINISFGLGLGGIDNIYVVRQQVLDWKLFFISLMAILLFLIFTTSGMLKMAACISGICFFLSAFEIRRNSLQQI